MASFKPKSVKRLLLFCCTVAVFLATLNLPLFARSKRRDTPGKDYKLLSKDLGYDVEITQELTQWQCDDETGIALLGKANNIVIDEYASRTLCVFMNEKKKQFDQELSIWEMNVRNSVERGFARFLRKTGNFVMLRKPVFFITVKVHRWYPFAYDGFGYSKHRFIASFSYKLPRTKLYGAFKDMDEQFAYVDRNNKETTDVHILASPVLSNMPEDTQTFTHEWLERRLDNGGSYSEVVRDIRKNLEPSTDFLMSTKTFSKMQSPVILDMEPVHFWEDGEECNAYDGRFITDTKGNRPKNNVCKWIREIFISDAADHPNVYVTRTVTIDVKKADFFNSERVGFCGPLKVSQGLIQSQYFAQGVPGGALKYPREVCFFSNNWPSKQRRFRNESRRMEYSRDITVSGSHLRDKREASRIFRQKMANAAAVGLTILFEVIKFAAAIAEARAYTAELELTKELRSERQELRKEKKSTKDKEVEKPTTKSAGTETSSTKSSKPEISSNKSSTPPSYGWNIPEAINTATAPTPSSSHTSPPPLYGWNIPGVTGAPPAYDPYAPSAPPAYNLYAPSAPPAYNPYAPSAPPAE